MFATLPAVTQRNVISPLPNGESLSEMPFGIRDGKKRAFALLVTFIASRNAAIKAEIGRRFLFMHNSTRLSHFAKKNML